MSGFLYRLVARTLGRAEVVRPRLQPYFTFQSDESIAENTERPGGEMRPRAHPSAPAAALPRSEKSIGEPAEPLARTERAGRRSDDIAPAEVAGESSIAERAGSAFVEEHREEPHRHISPQMVGYDDATPGERVAPRKQSVAPREAGEPAQERVPRSVWAAREARSPLSDEERKGLQPSETAAAEVTNDLLPAASQNREVFATLSDVIFATAESVAIDSPPPLAPILAGPRFDDRKLRRDDRAYGARRQAAHNDRDLEAEATVVNVTIGRIEVRSPLEPPTRAPRSEAPSTPQPRDQLDAYLRARRASRR
jgi:hypothetical protein